MALNRQPLQTVEVNGLPYHDYNRLRTQLVVGGQVSLVADPNNSHDRNAVKVCLGDRQVGWIPRNVNKDIAARLRDGQELTAVVSFHGGGGNLQIEVFEEPGAKALLAQLPFSCFIMSAPAVIQSLREFPIGTVFLLRTDPMRSSVSVADPHGRGDFCWFRKSALPDKVRDVVDGRGKFAAVLRTPGFLDIVRRPRVETPPDAPGYPKHLTDVIGCPDPIFTAPPGADSNKIPRPWVNPIDPHPTNPSETLKENTMSLNNKISNTVTATVDFNKNAASAAAYQEAGRIAVNQLTKVASKALPMMVRGYADTVIGKLVIANLAQMAAAQLRPEDTTLAKLTFAMTTAAYAEVIRTIDIEAMLDGLMGSPEIQRAIKKMPQDASDVNYTGRAEMQ